MKTREWLFIVLLVVLGQMLLSYVAFDFAGSGRALGYISIAGTIVSIVLGMIAIIYSFVQSVTHSNSVSDIRSQVQKLVEVGDGISNLEEGLQKSAKKINRATKELYGHINENTNIARRVAENIEGMSHAYNKDSSSDRGEALNEGYYSQWVLLDICHLMIIDLVSMDMDLVEFHKKILEPYSKKVELFSADFMSGALTVTSFSVIDKGYLQLIDSEEKPVKFKKMEGFDKYMAAVKVESENSTSEEIISYISCVRDLRKNN